jgi:hypothetical protein
MLLDLYSFPCSFFFFGSREDAVNENELRKSTSIEQQKEKETQEVRGRVAVWEGANISADAARQT